MAADDANLIPVEPPRWLQRALLLVLNARDRDTISGDLLEEYREEQLPHSGSFRAAYWYLRQVVSLASIQLVGGPLVKQALVLASLLTTVAGLWLCAMENVLKHDGYHGRSIIAICIAIQGLATLLFALLHRSSAFRKLIMPGAAAILCLGSAAVFNILRAQHFEGFVLLIGLALIAQSMLTFATLFQTRRRPAR